MNLLALLLLQHAIVFSPSANTEPISYSAEGVPEVFFETQGPNTNGPSAPVPIVAHVILQDGRNFTAGIGVTDFVRLSGNSHSTSYRGWSTFTDGQQQILGFHVYETRESNGFTSIGLNFSNGTVDQNNHSCGNVYYSSIYVDFGVNVTANLRKSESIIGNRYTIVPSGQHFWPVRAEFCRRVSIGAVLPVIYPVVYHKYGTLKSEYPTEVSNSTFESQYSQLVTCLRDNVTNSNVGMYQLSMGPFMCPFDNQPGDVGGTGIQPDLQGYPSYSLAKLMQLRADLQEERNPIAAYNIVDGMPMLPRIWAHGTKSQGFEYRLTRGHEGIVQIPYFFPHDFNTGTCTYKDNLWSFLPDDEQHECRYSQYNQAGIFLLNDALCKHRLAMEIADLECQWTTYGVPPYQKVNSWDWVPFSINSQQISVANNPHRGLGQVMRGVGWSLNTVAAYLASNGPSRLRREQAVWTNTMLTLIGNSVLPSGIGIDGKYPYADNGVPWIADAMPQNYGEAPMFQVPIWCNGIYSATQNTIGNDAILAPTILRSADCLYFSTLPRVPSIWGGNAVGPPYYPVTSIDNTTQSTLSIGYGLSHWLHCYHHLALAYRVSHDHKYLDAMKTVGVPSTSLPTFTTVTDKTWTLQAESVLK